MAPTLRRRLASLLYESLVAIAIVLMTVAVFSLVTMAVPSFAMQRQLLLATCFATLGGYFIYCWRHGQTLAMRAWKIRITDADGRGLSLGRACTRFVLGWVWVAPPLAIVSALKPHAASLSAGMSLAVGAVLAWVVAWSLASFLRADRQFWHDAAAGTRIVAT